MNLALTFYLQARSYSRLLLIRSFTSRLLWPLLTSVRSALLYAMVTSFKAYRTDLPRYHTFLPLHPSASSIMHDSVQLLGFNLACNLTLMHNLIWDFCPSDQRFARELVCSSHPASFRFHLTMDTLAFGYILPTTGWIRDFNPLETCAARRTMQKRVWH